MKKVVVLQHVEHEGLGTIGPALARKGYEPCYVRLYRGDRVPRDISEYAFLIVLGGPMGVYEEARYPFLTEELRLIERTLAASMPVLGVCLGHQCIGQAYGAKIVRAERLMHGKVSNVYHNGEDLFNGLENPFEATRYHSLIIKDDTVPDCLEVTARTDKKEIMGIRHKQLPVYGVQFHPESILTVEGKRLLKNFLNIKIR